MGLHKVRQGDCISSIASKHGLFWETLWSHPDNSELKRKRKDPNALLLGDEVFVPDKEKKTESGACEQKHRFRARGVPAKMKVRFLADEEPRSNQKFRLYVDGTETEEGKLDKEGYLEAFIPPDCKSGEIVIYDDEGNEERYPFEFGSVDPIDTDEGVKERLFNLGYEVEDFAQAVGEFQEQQKLTKSGSVDAPTRSKLKEVFGQ